MANNRGYSLVMWAVVFGLVIAGVAMFQGTLKRGMMAKAMGITDHAFWRMWGDTVHDYMEIDRSTATSSGRQEVRSRLEENNSSINLHAVITNSDTYTSTSLD